MSADVSHVCLLPMRNASDTVIILQSPLELKHWTGTTVPYRIVIWAKNLTNNF